MENTYPEFDLKFLANPSDWGCDVFGRKRCCVKSADFSVIQFGVIYADDLLTIYEVPRPGHQLTWKEQKFSSIEELFKVWMID